jgi:hypothetical protein
MLNKKLTNLMCSVGLVVAGGVFGSQAVFAHDHDDKKGDDMMMKADTNHDGMISAAEHAAYAQQMFNDADTNHDGMLSKDEIEAAHKKMRAEHEEMEHHGKHHDDDSKDAAERSKKDDDAEDAAERK